MGLQNTNFVIVTLMALIFSSQLSADETEKEVLAAVSSMWDEARTANLTGMFSAMPDEHSYIMQGLPLWDKQQTYEAYTAMFVGVVRQDIEMQREDITVINDKNALYVADAYFRQYDSDGNILLEGPYALSMVLQKREGQWLNLHTHQSFPEPE